MALIFSKDSPVGILQHRSTFTVQKGLLNFMGGEFPVSLFYFTACYVKRSNKTRRLERTMRRSISLLAWSHKLHRGREPEGRVLFAEQYADEGRMSRHDGPGVSRSSRMLLQSVLPLIGVTLRGGKRHCEGIKVRHILGRLQSIDTR